MSNRFGASAFKEILGSLTDEPRIAKTFETVKKSPELEIPDYLTSEQRNRDKATTRLYGQFVDSHSDKKTFSKETKEIIRNWCIRWVTLLVIACIGLSAYIFLFTSRNVNDLVSLVAALIPLVSAILGTLNIVVKHVFPEYEERNITEIVKLIHENDLKNKQINLNYNNDSPDKGIPE